MTYVFALIKTNKFSNGYSHWCNGQLKGDILLFSIFLEEKKRKKMHLSHIVDEMLSAIV